jgi:lipopolysaccharide transport system permease protein
VTRTVITPPGRFGLPHWRELWDGRDVVYQFGKRDVLLRYRQTAVGVAWVLLQPLASAGIFSIIFGNVAKLPSGGVPYFLFSYISMLAWTLFSQLVGRSAGSLVANQALVSKVFFPRVLVPFSTALSVLLDFAVALVLGVVLLVVYRVNPGWPVLLLPLWVLILLVGGLGIGAGASAITVRYRDVNYVLPWVLQVLLYASPVAYSLSAVPANLKWLFTINPLSWQLECFRWSLLGTPRPPLWQIGGSVGVAAAVFFVGLLVFQSHERTFADVI